MPVTPSMRWFWDEFIAASGGADESKFYGAEHFGDSEPLANELAALVLAGKKHATASAVWAYEAEGRPLPAPGNLFILTDWAGQPQCMLRTTAVEVLPFHAVGPEFAAAEGEGDGSLAAWRAGHRAFFTRECVRMGRIFDESMLVLCECFEVIYRPVRRAPQNPQS